jgi:hypothetical protein
VTENLESAVAALYAVTLDEFVSRRKELARELRANGDAEAASELEGLRKPTVAAWAVNQLARREKMQVRSLLTSADRLRQAHRKVVEGGSLEPLERARSDERKAIRALARSARALLSEAGHSANESTLARIEETLHAAAVDERVSALVRDGRLPKEEKAAGLGLEAFTGKQASSSSERTRGEKRRAAKRDEARTQHELAKERLREARRAATEAERTVRAHEQALERAEGELKGRLADVKSAEREVERAQKSLSDLRSGP